MSGPGRGRVYPTMMELSDHELLARFSSGKEEKAFRALVDRHLPAVWAVAQSRTGDLEAARDLAQEAFTLLAREAGRIRAEAVVSGWLFLTVRNLASKWLRSNARRRHRELIYATDPAMESTSPSSDPALLKRILVPALDELPAKDRDMVLSRYFENRSCREIAEAAASTEEAVRKRTGRALEKLRLILARRGFASSAAALGGAITTFASTAPPAGLAQAITASSMAAAAVSGTVALTGFSAILAMTQTTKALAAVGVITAAGSAAWLVLKPRGASMTALENRSGGTPMAAARSVAPDRVRPPGAAAAEEAGKGDLPLNINREGLDPGELRSAEGMAEYLFKTHAVLGAGMPPSEIRRLTLADAEKNMKPLKAFLPLSAESAAAMERILTAHAEKRMKEIFWNDHEMVELLRANKGQFIEAMALKLMNGKPQFGDTTPELDRRAASWTPGVKEAAVGFLKSYVALSRRSNNVIDERDWTEDEPTLVRMRGEVPPDQAEAFEGFVAERRNIVREGRALTRSQQLAESLQLNAAQRQAVFEELLNSNQEDKARVEAILNEAQRAAYQKK